MPDAQHVAVLTEEHAREMAALLTDLAYLERCRTLGIEPKSGRRPRNVEQRERLKARLSRDLAYIRRRYESCLDLYDEAFGADAAKQLDEYVRAACRTQGQGEEGNILICQQEGDQASPARKDSAPADRQECLFD